MWLPGRRPTTLYWSLLLLVWAGAAAGAAEPRLLLAQPDAGRFPEVRLFAYPTGRDGHPLQDLHSRQFTVTEDGKPAAMLNVRGGSTGAVAVCLVLDRSGSMDQPAGGGLKKIEAARDAARLFVLGLRPADRAAVISFADESQLDQPLTDRRLDLLAALERHQAYGFTVLYDATYWGIQQVALRPQIGGLVQVNAGLANARRAVLVLTDGKDDGSRQQPREIIGLARANGVSIYTIGLGADVNSEALTQLARETGGEYYAAPSAAQLALIYQRMARRLQDEYSVAFRSPRPVADGTRREVTLKISDTGLPAARCWYQAPGRGSMVVSVGPANTGEGMVARPEADRRYSLGVGVVFVILGLIGAAAGSLLYLGRRHSRSTGGSDAAIVDFGDLWAHGPVTRIGRDDTNDVIVESQRVSRHHARIEADGGEYELFDEGSSNGTRINGAVVLQSKLRVGDRVQFGDAQFHFVGEPPE
jgi:VWFA-related protein